MRIGFVDDEERAALRLFLRALRRLDPAATWEATIVSARGPSSSTPLRADLEARVRYATPDELGEAEAARARTDVLVAASDGAAPAPGLLLRALNAGAVPLASRLPVYEEALGEGELRAAVRAARHRDARRAARSGSSPTPRCASACARPPRRCARS